MFKTAVRVTGLIDHVIAESTRVYVGTARADDFFIYHDHLTQFWDKDSVMYLKSRNMHYRFIQIYESTYRPRVINRRYWNCVVGDSPEMARG